jgi:hypothetical protein
MTDQSWGKLILEDILAKRDALSAIYRTFDRTVDRELLGGLSGFLLGVNDDLPNGLSYAALPKGEEWRLADVSPNNVTHLVWTLASLCRFSCTLPFFHKLRDLGENGSASGDVITDWHVNLELGRMSRREDAAQTSPMDMFLICLLSSLLPGLLDAAAWSGFPIRHGFQVLGYLFVEQSDRDCQELEKEWSVQTIDPSEDVTLESVVATTLRRLRSAGVIHTQDLAVPLLYGPENDCFYLSGVRELMAQSMPIKSEETLHQLRVHINARLSQTLPSDTAEESDLPDDVTLKIDAGSATHEHVPLMRLLDYAGSQLSTIREHMFTEALRQEPTLLKADTVAGYAQAVASVLHRCQPYESAFLWVKNQSTDGYDLSWAGGYDNGMASGLADRTLTSVEETMPWASLSLPSDHLPPGLDAQRVPVLQAANVIPDSLSTIMGGGAKTPVRARLLIPLVNQADGREDGCILELYLRQRYGDVAPFVSETCSLVARACLLARDIARDARTSKAAGFQQGEFTIAHEMGPSISILNKERDALSESGKLAVDYLEIWKRFVKRDWSEAFPEEMAKAFAARGLLLDAALRLGYHRARRRSVIPKLRVGNRLELWPFNELRNALDYWLDVSIDLPGDILVQNDEVTPHPPWVYQAQTWLLFHLIGACHHSIRYAFQKSAPFSSWESAEGIRKGQVTTTWTDETGDLVVKVSNVGGRKEPEPICRLDEVKAIRSSNLGGEIVMPLCVGTGAQSTDQRRVIVYPVQIDSELADGSYLWTAEVRIQREGRVDHV